MFWPISSYPEGSLSYIKVKYEIEMFPMTDCLDTKILLEECSEAPCIITGENKSELNNGGKNSSTCQESNSGHAAYTQQSS